jgi:hypothetical protein
MRAKTPSSNGVSMRSGGWSMSNAVESYSKRCVSFTRCLLTSTTAAVCSSLWRLTHTSRPNQAANSQSSTAQILKPVVPHHGSGASNFSKLAPNAHQPQTNKVNGIATAVATSTGRTVRRSKKRKAGGRITAGTTRTRRRGSKGTRDGRDRGVSLGACGQH